jgi:hypothetical protein
MNFLMVEMNEATANLNYAGESGGLGEATADIFTGAYSPHSLIGESSYCKPGMFDRSNVFAKF